MTDWFPSATRVYGPTWKRRSGTNPVKGAVLHSAEGTAAGLQSVLGDEKSPVNWHFSILKDGTVWQHHPITARLNHAADTWGNDNLVGIEHEGRAGEPLTVAQRQASVALVHWLASERGWLPARTGAAKTLWEHNEISDTGTQCPSGRIPWSYYVLAPVPAQKPPKAPTPLSNPAGVARFWSEAFKNGAVPERFDGDFAIYEIRIRAKEVK